MNHPSQPIVNQTQLNFHGYVAAGNLGLVNSGAQQSERQEIDLLTVLQPALDAEWEACCEAASGCLPGTREGVFKEIDYWRRGGRNTPFLYWLNGDGGTGKTAIMCSACRKYANEGVLGAAFFFSRDQETRCKISRLFFTLAYRLCFSFPQLRPLITQALEDRSILNPNMPRHLRELILIPIRDISSSLPLPILIVIDALDECDGTGGQDAIVEFIDTLARELEALGVDSVRPMIKILVASRPHPHLVGVFERSQVRRNCDILRLCDIGPSIHNQDLRLFAAIGMRDLASEYRSRAKEEGWQKLDANWPSESDITKLLDLSGGLFISVATLLLLLKSEADGKPPNPQRTLKELRGTTLRPAKKVTRQTGLDRTYRTVLQTAARIHRDQMARRKLRLLITFIILSFNRLPPSAISSLLFIEADLYIPALQSVVEVPRNNGPLRALHASFNNFMTDRERCSDTGIQFIDPQVGHLALAKICLQHLLRSIKRDLLGLDQRGVDQERLTLVENMRVQDRTRDIKLHLGYAAKFWIAHAIYSAVDVRSAPNLHSTPKKRIQDADLLDLMDKFAKTRILYWVEILSYLGYLAEGKSGLQRVLEILPKDCDALRNLLYDTTRVIQEHYAIISTSAMHIYFSALPFLPPRTELHRRFGHEKEGALMVKSRVKSHWAACVQSIGVDSQVYSVAVSEDGTRIAAGTESGQILVIDATTGTRIHQFQGHIDRIRSVAFSRDGKSIISSSYDQTVKFWDSMSGEERLRLSYTSHISSVAFSPDDARVVSGSGDGVVRVLDSKSGTALLTLVGHTDDISSVAFSPDGASIVSGSWDMDVRVWDNASGNPLLIMEDHTSNVSSVAFSPDGASIVSGSWDMSVRVWDSKSGRIQFILRGHRSPIYSVAFSPNGSRIVLGSEDGTVRVWDRLEGRELLTLQGHTSDVHSVAFLPDGVHIVSGSHDSTLRVWDRRFDVGQLSLRGHSGCVNSVAISPNGRLTVSGSDDRTVRVWDNTSGTELRILKAFAVVLEVSFTANGRYVEGRTNETVLRWEAGTGMKISHLDSSPEPRLTMRSLCFFENGRIVKTDTNGRIVAICHVPASYDVRNASFHGNIGALGLATGEVIILEIPV